MSVLTFGLYDYYWWYQHWKRVDRTGGDVSPFWRTFFAQFTSYFLFERVRRAAIIAGVRVAWHPAALAIPYLVAAPFHKRDDLWFFLFFLGTVPLALFQRTVNMVHESRSASATEALDDKFTLANLGFVLLFWVVMLSLVFLTD